MSTAEKANPKLWEKAKTQAKNKMGGKHSARAMQLAVRLYKEMGGKYKDKKKPTNKLTQWTKQDWTTKSGKKSRETGERYLPREAIKNLSSKEYAATTRKKREDTKKGKQVSKQPTKIAKKTAKYRRV
jgi:predicted transglutaminase-like protease